MESMEEEDPPPTTPIQFLEDTTLNNPTQCLTHLFTKDTDMTDLTIIIPGFEKYIEAHRLVLGMWSSYFKLLSDGI